MTATARDRVTAIDCWADSDPIEAIAAALAAERARVLAPVLALAEDLGRCPADSWRDGYRRAADRIRRAAQDGAEDSSC